MFEGSIVAMVTPMRADGAVDDAALARLVEFHVDSGTDAIVAVGTTGESATLDHVEHGEVIARVVELTAGRVPVIGGTGANSTAEAVSLTRHAADAGVDGRGPRRQSRQRPAQQAQEAAAVESHASSLGRGSAPGRRRRP